MAHQRSKLCPSCHTVFRGRKDARTCSDRCRKRLQRATASLQKQLLEIQAEEGLQPRDFLLYQIATGKVTK